MKLPFLTSIKSQIEVEVKNIVRCFGLSFKDNAEPTEFEEIISLRIEESPPIINAIGVKHLTPSVIAILAYSSQAPQLVYGGQS